MWKGKLYKDHILAPYTTWRVGGPAQYFYEPLHLDDLVTFLQQVGKNDRVLFLGGGSKVLIPDKGLDGVVIHTRGRITGLSQINEPYSLRAEAGVSCAQLISYCLRLGLVGSAFLTGIPGTIGGALVMNAGTFGEAIWQHVIAVETIDIQGNIRIREAKEFKTGYRFGVGDDFKDWFVAVYLKFAPGDIKAEKKKIQDLLQHRRLKQPINEFSCGSVFKNTLNQHAGRLIDSCGLKGATIGGAHVSEKHANFIVHEGEASAQNIQDLINLVHDRVLAEAGIDLKLEAKILK